jgi:Arc/MetJ-type ribon-helix-helix transcriptional regulator
LLPLYNLVREYLELNAYTTISDFIRNAIREKIERDAPHLYGRLSQRRESKWAGPGVDVEVVEGNDEKLK